MREKILYMELLADNFGNKRVDMAIISALSSFSNLTVVFPEKWFESSLPSNVTSIEYALPRTRFQGNKRIQHYLTHLNILKEAVAIDKTSGFDFLFFASYHTYVMALALLKFKRSKQIFILHHNNIDNMERSKKAQWFFRLYANSVNHVVFEDFIGEYLIHKYGIKKERVFTLKHPLNVVESDIERIYDCVGISNSNSEQWIDDIITLEQNEKVFLKSKKTVVLRSKEKEFDDGALKVVKGYLSDQSYYDYIGKAKRIFLPFPESFKYRMSGSLVDALSNNVEVIGTKTPLFLDYERRYPGVCHTVENSQQLVEKLLCSEFTSEEQNKNFDKFRKIHSEKEIVEQLKKIFVRSLG